MKKIGILAVHNHNYGSILQTYATQKIIDGMEVENEIIYYKKTNIFRQLLRIFNLPWLKFKLKTVYRKIYSKFINKNIGQLFSSRDEAFSEFIKDNLKFSKPYIGRNALIEGTKNYDAFVLGSDQVWNPINLGNDYFTMNFIPEGKLKITYAPSFGVSRIPKSQLKKTRNYLSRINHISVREVTGQKIVKELTNREVPIVVDPTLLLDKANWDEIKGDRIIKEKYIVCYFIGVNPLHREFAEKLKKETGYKIVALPHIDEIVEADFNFGDIVPNNVGPSEFINFISNAEYVCTDSFHGTIFSVLYKKDFFVFRRFNEVKKDSTNSRLHSILTLLGVETRLLSGDEDIKTCLTLPLKYKSVYEKLDILRENSSKYLMEALKPILRGE